MAFAHKTEQNQVPESEAEKKQKENLHVLNNQLNDAQGRLESLTVTENDVQDAKSLLQIIHDELNNKSVNLASVNNDLEKAISDLNGIVTDVSFQKSEYDILLKNFQELKTEGEKLIVQIQELSFIKGKLESENADLKIQNEVLISNLDTVKKNHDKKIQAMLAEELTKKQDLDKILNFISDTQALALQTSNKITSASSELSDLNETIKKQQEQNTFLNEQYVHKQAELEKKLQDTETIKKVEWEAREGAISRSVQILDQKRNELIQIKIGLEQHFGKPIKMNI